MSAPALRLGAAAHLTGGESIHRVTFVRALAMGCADTAARHGRLLQFCLAADYAAPDGARRAAAWLVGQGVAGVVGHYASAAADAAAARYARHRIPLLLPAATADDLTARHPTVFRLCGRDSGLAATMARDMRRRFGLGRLALFHDGSRHGESLSLALRRECARQRRLDVSNDLERAGAAVFVGDFQRSVEFVAGLRRRGWSRPILLTDDAVHPALGERLRGDTRQVYVYGFEPTSWCPAGADVCARYRARWGADPGAYFLPTYAAIEIFAELAAARIERADLVGELAARRWQTVLGDVRFVAREADRAGYALWRFAGGIMAAERCAA
jgi:ABC-type branched-subunit amino acid transport system substrate-binding protein